jgi:hypothetical protein
MAALGDLVYRGSSVWKRLAGQVTTSKKFLRQVGSGAASAAPTWETIASDDLSDVVVGEVSVSSPELLALRATPKLLLAAPGAGLVLDFIGAWLALDATATAYVEAAANLGIRFTGTTGALVSDAIETTGFIDQTTDTMTTARRKADAIIAKAACENQGLYLHNLGAGEFTTGTGVLRVKIVARLWTTGW